MHNPDPGAPSDDGDAAAPHGTVGQFLTPSKVTAWLSCDHTLTLRRLVDAGALPRPEPRIGSFARLLQDKGMTHEQACLDDYRTRGLDVVEVPARGAGEPFGDWHDRVASLLDAGHDVLAQMPLVHDQMRGIADFLERVDLPGERFTYEPVDAKLARVEAKPGHVLQLAFYAEAIEAALGARPKQLHVLLGSGRRDSIRTDEVLPYWQRVRRRLTDQFADPVDENATTPEPCSHCQFCEFAPRCERQWRDADAVHYVANLHRTHRQALEDAGVQTRGALADRQALVDGLDDGTLRRLRTQAALQVAADDIDGPPPHRQVAPTDHPRFGRGHELLPQPDVGDVFLDFEGHPFWRPDRGLFFLFGLIARDDDGTWTYRARWAHDVDAERAAATWLVQWIHQRRREHPDMHVYHYNHTERSSLERLHVEHDLDDTDLAVLVREGTFVDLLDVVRNAVQVGAESYSLKQLEQVAGYRRGHDIKAGAGAVVAYETFTGQVPPDDRAGAAASDPQLRQIAAYNEDDVRATLAVRDWLVEIRPSGTAWRAAVLNPEPDHEDRDATVEALHALGGDDHQLLAALLQYWRREDRANAAHERSVAESPVHKLAEDEDAVVGLHSHTIRPPEGRSTKSTLVAQFPEQAVAPFDTAMYITDDGPPAYGGATIDPDTRYVELKVGQEQVDRGDTPTVLVASTWFNPEPKPTRLREWADQVLAVGGLDHVDDIAAQLLARRPSRFVPRGGTTGGRFSNDLDEQVRYALELDRSYLAIQGPPGTGKTYRAARLIRGLLLDGRRVGVTAMSHAAIHNLVKAVHKAMKEAVKLDHLSAVVKRSNSPTELLAGVDYARSNGQCANLDYNLVAGTTWLFANDVMADAPVDVLVVDEAGQLGLADTLAATASTDSLILTGDPQQLPQVTKASHPAEAGRSALGHLLRDRHVLPDDEGIFLTETRRMHPDVCRFISDQFYRGQLTSHPDCDDQTTELGTGLRWVEVRHQGCSTRSLEEVEAVADLLTSLLGRNWTDADGSTRPLDASDVLVVTPYNRQKDALRRGLQTNPRTADVPVGTVDKFQGQEAPVVVFSAAASSGEDASRGVGFVFDRNRFNVAISRAQCLAYLVCTSALIDTNPTSVGSILTLSGPTDLVHRAENQTHDHDAESARMTVTDAT